MGWIMILLMSLSRNRLEGFKDTIVELHDTCNLSSVSDFLLQWPPIPSHNWSFQSWIQ